MKTLNTIKEEFEAMTSMPIFEIEVNEEYYIYHIIAGVFGLEAGSCSNTGFGSMGLDVVDYDDCFSLDEHLEELYSVCYEDAILQNKGGN